MTRSPRATLTAATALLIVTVGGCGTRSQDAGPDPAPPAPVPVAVAGGASATPGATSPAPAATTAKPGPAKAAATTKAAAAPTSRDKFRWPFSATSVWNTPIGSRAKYVKVGIGSTGVGVDTVHILRVAKTDPVVPSYDAGAFVGTRCAGTKPQQQSQWHAGLEKVQIPAGALFPDADLNPSSYFTPNGKLTLLMPDGKTLRQFLPACRNSRSGPLYGYAFPPQNVYGDGLCCGHGGSSLSAMGGTLRKGELTGDQPIRHALAINLWGNYLHFDSSTGSGHVWPAGSHDGAAASTYKGRDRNLKMGSLLAIPPSVSERSLKLETKAGRKLFHALQDYGTYVVDDSGQNTQDLNMEKSAEDELKRTVTGGKPIYAYGPLSRDVTKLMKQARVVVNNGPKSVGGGGTPRAPKAPKISN
jgi:hypothetical protein